MCEGESVLQRLEVRVKMGDFMKDNKLIEQKKREEKEGEEGEGHTPVFEWAQDLFVLVGPSINQGSCHSQLM